MGPQIIMSQQPQGIAYARGGQQQEVNQLLEAAREDEEEQLVYQNAQDDGMVLAEGQEPYGDE